MAHELSSCSSWFPEYRLSSCGVVVVVGLVVLSLWDPPAPGIEPVFPALADRFFTTESPGEPPSFI